jgi:hypothetical protein
MSIVQLKDKVESSIWWNGMQRVAGVRTRLHWSKSKTTWL